MSYDSSLSADPIKQFRQWFKDAGRRMDMPEAMCLSTVNAQGYPTARMVLLKDVSQGGFNFFTNIESPKARELLARRRAALTFYWQPLRRQVRVEGIATRLPKRAADAYFATRSRDSQLGSWASLQSRPLSSRAALLNRFQQFVLKFKGKKVSAPPHWQGFHIAPVRIEFWQEQPNRLHDRWMYVRGRGGRWGKTRLYP